MQSRAKTVSEYTKSLPPERKRDFEMVRKVIKRNLPKGYKEMMQWGMVSYAVPLSIYPKGYGENPDVPLPYLSLASQKNYLSLYFMNLYGNSEAEKWFRGAFKKSGKKLNMGKSCVRFRSAKDLPLDVIGQAVALTPVKKYIKIYETARSRRK